MLYYLEIHPWLRMLHNGWFYTLSELPSDVLVCTSLEDAIRKTQSLVYQVFVIGGGEIYTEALSRNLVSKIYYTKIHINTPCDVFFPTIPPSFNLIETRSITEKDTQIEFMTFILNLPWKSVERQEKMKKIADQLGDIPKLKEENQQDFV